MMNSRLFEAIRLTKSIIFGGHRRSMDKSRVVAEVRRFLISRSRRGALYVRMLDPKSIHQVASTTRYDRYPSIFDAARTHFGEKEPLKILSFGCSTGEEAFTLRYYFPTAQIIGADIVRNNLKIATERNTDRKIDFIFSSEKNLRASGPFDLVFCMAVLQRSELSMAGVTSSEKIYPFRKFDRQIALLDALLNRGGMLVLQQTNYRFGDSMISTKYRPIQIDPPVSQKQPLFDRNNRLIGRPDCHDVMFVKKAD